MTRHYFTLIVFSLIFSSLLGVKAEDSFLIDDFEDGLQSWIPINDKTHITFEIVSNPSICDENPSAHVLKCTRQPGSVNWAGVILRDVYSLLIGTDESEYSSATIKFMKESRGDVSFKLESGPDDETYESTVSYPSSSGWVTLTFDLRNATPGTYSDFFVMVDRDEDISSQRVVYIDEITLHKSQSIGESVEIDPNLQNGTGEEDSYKVVWQDLFDDNSLNPDYWNVEVRGDGGGNNELQYYEKENITVSTDESGNGCLIITAKKESRNGKSFTSGRLTTQNKVYFTHGKIEASIRLPQTANGLWPAFWLLGNDIESNPWPYCGEIDILEMGNQAAFSKGTQDRYFNGACHWGPLVDGGHPNYSKFNTWYYSLQDSNYHLYTLYWDDEKVSMYVDKDRYPDIEPYYEMTISDSTQENSPGRYFHHDFFLLFNLAVGGDFPQIYTTDGVTALASGEAKMYVNYVKVYQKKEVDTSVEESYASRLWLNEGGDIYSITGQFLLHFDAGQTEKLNVLPANVYILKENNSERCQKMVWGK